MAAVPGLGKAEMKGKGACVFPSSPGREGLVRPPGRCGPPMFRGLGFRGTGSLSLSLSLYVRASACVSFSKAVDL